MKNSGFKLSKPLNHIALIMDGNGRWAKARNKPRTYGHQVAINNLMELINECHKLQIGGVSLFAFSTENWKRPKAEINMLFKYLKVFFKKNIKQLMKNDVRIYVSGDYHKLPPSTVKAIENALELTKNKKGMKLNICLNYGGQDEIIRAIKQLVKSKKEINQTNLEKCFANYDLGPIDLLIRTSGEVRISNFMLYQLAYSEMIFYTKPFPDFKIKDLHLCLKEYSNRHRRYGGLKNA